MKAGGLHRVLGTAVLLWLAGCSELLPEVEEVDSRGGSAGSGSTASGTSESLGGATENGSADATGTSETNPVDSEISTGTTTPGDTRSDSSDEGPRPVCSNGMVESGEDCDDMNGEELDGCLSSCRFGPTALTFGGLTDSTMAGPLTTMLHVDECPAGEVLVGFTGRVGTTSGRIRSLQGVCEAVELGFDGSGFVVEFSPGTTLPVRGSGNPQNDEMFCTAGDVVMGFTGQDSSEYLEHLGLLCATPSIVDTGTSFEVQLSAPTPTDVMGFNMDGMPFPDVTCPPGAIAAGPRIYTDDDYLHGFGLRCSELGLQLGS